jgi:hypothetical protein
LWDRIDIHVEVPRVDHEKLSDDRFGEPSDTVQARIEAARERQRQRIQANVNLPNDQNPQQPSCNSDMHPAEVRKYCQLDDTSRSLMRSAMHQMQLSARAYHRVLKLARTIADLARESAIGSQHLAEALQYRPKLTQFYAPVNQEQFFTSFLQLVCSLQHPNTRSGQGCGLLSFCSPPFKETKKPASLTQHSEFAGRAWIKPCY